MNTNLDYDIMDSEDYDNQDDYMLRTTNDIHLEDLMGNDHSVWLQQNSQFGFDLHIANDDDLDILNIQGIHPFAIASLATFCERFLASYTRLKNKEESQ